MQLFILLALLLAAGKGGAQNILNEVKPVIEKLGTDEMKEAFKSAEEIGRALSAVSAVKPAPAPVAAPAKEINFPLDPISKIADREITYSLSQYICQ